MAAPTIYRVTYAPKSRTWDSNRGEVFGRSVATCALSGGWAIQDEFVGEE